MTPSYRAAYGLLKMVSGNVFDLDGETITASFRGKFVRTYPIADLAEVCDGDRVETIDPDENMGDEANVVFELDDERVHVCDNAAEVNEFLGLN